MIKHGQSYTEPFSLACDDFISKSVYVRALIEETCE